MNPKQFSINPDLIQANEALNRAKSEGNKEKAATLEFEFKEIEYRVYKELLDQQVLGNLE